MYEIKENIKKIFEHISEIALKNNRNPNEITIVAVSKTFPKEFIIEAYNAGLTEIGESYIQEAENKINELKNYKIKWHLVGHLQSNKAKKAVQLFDTIQSIDKLSTLEKVDKISNQLNKIQEVFIEVNTSFETSKFGINPDELIQFLNVAKNFKNIKINGLMTIGPLTDDKKLIKNSFLKLKELFYKANEELKLEMKYLSMGMSDDYDIAIECGSNMLRIGRKIFGERRF
jgi:pyridoxal phosphate enzyme (YggS family)